MSSEHGKAPLARRDFIAVGAASLGGLEAGSAKAAAATSPYDPPTQSDPRSEVNALVFDVFGTVVGWRESIIREGKLLGERKGIDVDWVELFAHYKSDPEAYLGAARLPGPTAPQVMMAAAHVDDLIAARKVGLRTALVTRPLEYGPKRKPDTAQDGEGIADFVASDFMDLATQLGV